MGLKNVVADAWRRIEADLSGKEVWWKVSPAHYLSRAKLVPLLQRHVRGRLLDVGCGRMPYQPYLADSIDSYDGYDVERRSAQTRFLGDAHDLAEIADDQYDTVISLSVLEHLKRPWVAIGQMSRVCKPGGTIIIEVPHLSRYHELPHDYYRFTEHGLRELGTDAGLELVHFEAHGGVFAFLAHQLSTACVSLAWGVPILKWIVFGVNYLVVVRSSCALDRLLGTSTLLPMSVAAVFAKPNAHDSLEPD